MPIQVLYYRTLHPLAAAEAHELEALPDVTVEEGDGVQALLLATLQAQISLLTVRFWCWEVYVSSRTPH